MGDTDTTKFQYSWLLWYHDPASTDYSLEGYVRIADMSNPTQLWSVIDSIPKEAFESGMFFFMKRGYRPIWDTPENEAGGAWSKKIETSKVYTAFIDLAVHAVANELLINRKETLSGITLSPKGAFSIVKIWNTTTTVSSLDYINSNIPYFPIGEDVTYTPHKARPK